MRVYIDGKIARKDEKKLNDNQCFLPAGLWFCSPWEEFDYEITNGCIRLDGLECESAVDKETNIFTCRWKGVELCYIDPVNRHIETEDFEIEDFMTIVNDCNMRLVNMDAYYDGELDVVITSLHIVDDDIKFDFDTNLIDKIELLEY